MLPDWAFAQRGSGVIVLQPDATVTVLEYYEFLGRIADGRVRAEDQLVSALLTDGRRRRVGDLRVYAMVRSGEVRTEDLPPRVPNGVLATGAAAKRLLRAIERPWESEKESETLLRAVLGPVPAEPPGEMLRTVAASPSNLPADQLLHSAEPPDTAEEEKTQA